MDFTSWEHTFDGKDTDALMHYGVLGMKWGQRRYQHRDGSLTEAGVRHYAKTGEYGFTYKSHATKKYDRKAARVGKRLAKAQQNSATWHKNAKEERYWKERAEKEGKAGGEAHQNYSKWEKQYGNKAAKYDKQVAKLSAKASKYQNRANRSRELDRKEQDYAQSVRAAGNVAARFLANVGGKGYQMHLAMNRGQGSGSKAAAWILNKFTGGRLIGGNIRKAAYIRQDEKKVKSARVKNYEKNKENLRKDAEARAEKYRQKANARRRA